MLGVIGFKTKKQLKAAIGRRLDYYETSLCGAEYKETGQVEVVGPNAHRDRKWYATVTLVEGVITEVK